MTGNSRFDIRAHGFRWDQGEVTTYDYPGAWDTALSGVNGVGWMVGGAVIGDPEGPNHGILVDKAGGFATLLPPGWQAFWVYAINAAGVMAGSYLDQDSRGRGFVARRCAGTPAE